MVNSFVSPIESFKDFNVTLFNQHFARTDDAPVRGDVLAEDGVLDEAPELGGAVDALDDGGGMPGRLDVDVAPQPVG